MSLTRCTECLMPTTRPDTAFEGGICSACIAFAQRSKIDWAKRQSDLLTILESAQPSSAGYDCVVPSSGGKDSHWQVLKLIELGAKPLVVTAATCMPTEIGQRNIENLARYATTLVLTPNREVRKVLNRLGLELVGDISLAEHYGIFATPWRIARDFGIPLVFYGENPQNAYGGPIETLDAYKMDRRWVSEFGGHLGLRPSDLVGGHGLTREHMADYQMPTEQEMGGISTYFLGAFFPWNSHLNARVAVRAGMRVPDRPPSIANWWTAENLDNLQTSQHDYFGALKFGYGRLCAQISVDIRYGMMTREEAVPIVRERDCAFPENYLGVHYTEILDHIEMSHDRFLELCADYANRNIWHVTKGEFPVLRQDVWEASFN